MPNWCDILGLSGTAQAQLRGPLHLWTCSDKYATAPSELSKVLKALARPAYWTTRANCGVLITRATATPDRWHSTQNRSSSVNATESAYVTSERSMRMARSSPERERASRISLLRPISSSPHKRIVLMEAFEFTRSSAVRLPQKRPSLRRAPKNERLVLRRRRKRGGD